MVLARPLLVASAALLVAATIPGAALDPLEAQRQDPAEAPDVPAPARASDPARRAGQGQPGAEGTDPCIPGSRLAADACSRWTDRREGDGGAGFGGTQAVGPDGRLYVVAREDDDLSVVAYQGDTGEVYWSRTLDLPGKVKPSGSYGWGLTAAAAYVSGTVVVAAEFTDPAGGPTEVQLASLEADDGASRWTARYQAGTGGSAEPLGLYPGPDGAEALLVARAFGDDPRTRPEVVALDAGNGAVAWSVEPDPLAGHDDYPLDATYDTGRGLVAVSGVSFTDAFEDYDAYVTAVDVDAGQAAWSRAWDGSDSLAGAAVAASADASSLYTIVHDHVAGDYEVVALEPGAGATDWTQGYVPARGNGDHEVQASVGPGGDAVFVSANVETQPDPVLHDERVDVLALEADSGAIRWRSDDLEPDADAKDPLDLVSPAGTSCTFALETAITKPRLPDYRVTAYDRSTGESVWRRYLGSDEGAWPGLPGDLAWNGEEGLLHVTGSLHEGPHLDSPVHVYVLGRWFPPEGATASAPWSAATATYGPPC